MTRDHWLEIVRRAYRARGGRQRVAVAWGVNHRTEAGQQFVENIVAEVALGATEVEAVLADLATRLIPPGVKP